MKRISLFLLVGLVVSVCLGQTLESFREVYSNDLARIELKKAEVMKVALAEYVAGLDKVRDGFVNSVNVKGIKAVDEIKAEIFNGSVKFDPNLPEFIVLAKKYKDRETIADSTVLVSKRSLLEKYRAALKSLCASYLKTDMAKAEMVSAEMEIIDAEIKSVGALLPEQKKESIPDKKIALKKLNEPVWEDITETFTGGERTDEGIVLKGAAMISKANYKPPVKIEYVCKTDSTNIRIMYACREIIFNWECSLTSLRIDGGPASGQFRNGAGKVPINKFVTIRQVVLPNKMEIFVDNELRASWDADFSKINSTIGVRAPSNANMSSMAGRSFPTVVVKSVRVSK